MRTITACLYMVLGSACIAGAQPRKPNTLTPAQIEAGWILLFDGETTFGWKQQGDATWSVVDGAIVPEAGKQCALITNTEFGPSELTFDMWSDGPTAGSVAPRMPPGGKPTDWAVPQSGRSRGSGKWVTLSFVDRGPKAGEPTKAGEIRRGAIALVSSGRGHVRFRNIRLRPLAERPIFNGKDLSGWTVVPGHPSVFSVTPEGWMNVKNGNGDIQTTGQWGDFTLQLDVFSNGPHLNSGVFFRANAGQFWSGYECQIRNQWEGDDRTKAVDYGTGGIYNRQPARKVVSSDREWFTLTIVATGMHMAVWNNGYQVSDFTDERPVDQTNGRNGARSAPGVFSLQGHDPTTDLSFRNIRAVELPAR